MKQSQQRFFGLTSAVLLATASFAACGGLDSRRVTADAAGNANSGGSASNGGDNPLAGAGFGGEAPVLDGPPEVIKVDPKDAEVDVEVNASVNLLFSEALDAATVTTDNVQVLDGTTPLEGELKYESGRARFDPNRRLSLLAEYEVTASTAITDTTGNALKSAFSSKFIVRDGVWTAQAALADKDPAQGGDAAMDARGNLLYVTSRTVGSGNAAHGAVFARWYRVATNTWQEEVQLSKDADNAYGAPAVSVSPEGNAVVAWYTYSSKSALYAVQARRFIDDNWESAPQHISGTGKFNSGGYSAVAIGIGGGQVAAAWIRIDYNNSISPARSTYFLSVTSTSTDGAWPSDPTEDASAVWEYPTYQSYFNLTRLVLDTDGNALVVTDKFSNDTGDNGKGVYFTRKAAGGPWSEPSKIAGSTTGSSPSLATDGSGAMVVFRSYNEKTFKYDLFASRYTRLKQFAAPVSILEADISGYPNVSANPITSDGKVYWATWVQPLGTARNTYVNRYDIASGKWDAAPTAVSDGITNTGYTSNVGIDAHGNAIVAFDQQAAQPNQFRIVAARYNARAQAWSTPVPLTADDKATYQPSRLAVAPNGVGALLFESYLCSDLEDCANLGTQYTIFK